MARLRFGRLPARVEYADLPPWDHNYDNVFVRTVNAAWNALFTTELTDFSFKELAIEVGCTPAALYRYFPTISSLGAQLASSSVSTLLFEMADDLSDTPPQNGSQRKHLVREVVRKYLLFAEKRPRHFSVMLSAQYSDPQKFPALTRKRADFAETIGGVLMMELGRSPTAAETHCFWSLVHGSAALVASGQKPQRKQVFAALEQYLEGVRKS